MVGSPQYARRLVLPCSSAHSLDSSVCAPVPVSLRPNPKEIVATGTIRRRTDAVEEAPNDSNRHY